MLLLRFPPARKCLVGTFESFLCGIGEFCSNLHRSDSEGVTQCHRSVAEYIEEFNNLARYAPDDVDTNAKRKEKFLEGLNDEMCMQLSVAYVQTYQSLCDKDTILESKMKQVENRKRKHHFDKQNSGSSHKRSDGDDSGGSRSHKCHIPN